MICTKILLRLIDSSDGYTEEIIIPNKGEETVKKAVNSIHGEGYVEEHCRDWDYNSEEDGGSYYDAVNLEHVTISFDEIKELK